MKIFILAGEPSGDLHAGKLSAEIFNLAPQAELFGWGGDQMKDSGVQISVHCDDLAFMGFWEVAKNLPTIFSLLKKAKKEILEIKPDVLVLVDYPGFNLRMAKWAKQQGIRVAWYIAPQVWAWKAGRTHALKRYCDRLITILPFETDFFAKYDMAVDYVGHPLLDRINSSNDDDRPKEAGSDHLPILAILPGSRRQEIRKMLPLFYAAAIKNGSHRIVIAAMSAHGEQFYRELLPETPSAKLVFDGTYDLLSKASIALVTSGTATLETALFDVPQVVAYKGNPISYLIGKQLVNIDFIAMPNLIAGKAIVTELIQDQVTVERLNNELEQLSKKERREQMQQDYTALKLALGGSGASAKAARIIVDLVNQSS